ncbi:hypothetical protein EYZ11_012770 [Aspergillus tanneri]|uniref:Uncharacterized protein n=1 Tax=Aspergillus tanneri TaxID=1220188 RepID=A0A4S3IZM8_9EURO|nr:hypothetical protein EYZ11_012770 [Aspergillus tanneri]
MGRRHYQSLTKGNQKIIQQTLNIPLMISPTSRDAQKQPDRK